MHSGYCFAARDYINDGRLSRDSTRAPNLIRRA
jgi:hypothetical protein